MDIMTDQQQDTPTVLTPIALTPTATATVTAAAASVSSSAAPAQADSASAGAPSSPAPQAELIPAEDPGVCHTYTKLPVPYL